MYVQPILIQQMYCNADMCVEWKALMHVFIK